MSHVHFIGGEKGGVGKSVVARLLAQYFIDHEIRFSGLDADRSHPALLRFYNDYSQAIELDNYQSLDQIMESALESEQRILIDLGAQSQHAIFNWANDSGVLEMAEELSVQLVYWHLLDGGNDSVSLLSDLFERYGDQLQYILVKNLGCGDNFSLFDDAPVKEQALELGAKIVTLPALHSPTMLKIDATNASFWAAVHNNDNKAGLSLMERQRAKVWLRHVYQALDAIHDVL